MRQANLESLKNEIARHEIRPYLAPLQRFRGNVSIHRVHALWNFANAMMLSECESLAEGTRLYQSGDIGHLCGLHSKFMSHYSLAGIFNRIRLSPKVAALKPGMLEYADWVNPYRFDLARVGAGKAASNRRALKTLTHDIGKSDERFYPFISRASTDDHALLMQIHAAVPRAVDHSIRGDVCQDLVCGVLAGEIRISELREAVPIFLETWRKLRPHELGDYYRWAREVRGAEHGDDWKEEYIACEHADEKNEGFSMRLPTDWLDQLKREYPKRNGDNGWIAVRTLVPRALTAGATWERIMAGTKAYRVHCDKTEATGTAYVKQARTFYGPEQYFEEWADMQPAKTGKQVAEDVRWDTLKARAKVCGLRPPTQMESQGAYETLLKLAEQDHAVTLARTTPRPVVNIVADLAQRKRVQ